MIHRRTYKDNPEWKAFYPFTKFQKYLEQMIREEWISSAGTEIHLDIYPQAKAAPTVVYCHGLSSCGRMMANMAAALYEKGYNVVCPDLKGFGLNFEDHGTGTIPELVTNLVDTVAWARRTFQSSCYLTGISLGGSLTYYAAAAGADVQAIACFNIMDLSHSDTLKISHRAQLVSLLKPFFNVSQKCFPRAKIPLKFFIDVEKLSDQPQVIETFRTNPLVVKHYTYEAAYSLISTPPAVPFRQFNRLPVLVLHGEKDRLIPASLSRANYEQLASEKKFVLLKDCEHVPVRNSIIEEYTDELKVWFP